MTTHGIKNICATGPGAMGAGTALCFAMAGYDVQLWGRKESSLQKGRNGIENALRDYTTHGLLDEAKIPEIWSRIILTTDLAQAARHADMVIESISEKTTDKQAHFAELDPLCPAHTIFGTNTSSLDLDALSGVMSPARHAYFTGTHLFNPPHLMSLAEIAATKKTAPEVMDTIHAVMLDIGKEPVLITPAINGYIVNRVQAAMWHAAYELHDHGHHRDDIDQSVVLTLGRGFSVLKPFEVKNGQLSDQQHYIAHHIHAAMRRAAVEIVNLGNASAADVESAVFLTLGMRLQETGPLMSADLTGLDIVRNIKNELKHPIAPFLEKAVADKRLGAKTHEEQPNLREGMYVWQQANEKAVKGRRTATFIAYHKQRMQGTNPVRPTQQGLLLENNNG